MSNAVLFYSDEVYRNRSGSEIVKTLSMIYSDYETLRDAVSFMFETIPKTKTKI